MIFAQSEERIFNAFSQSDFIVIELFTSQGCSSCPPADKNVSTVLDAARKENIPIYSLGWHVDYWNYLGWRDPYSSKANTQRQRKYAQIMRQRTIYTPQVILNGHVVVRNSFSYPAFLSSFNKALPVTPNFSLAFDITRIPTQSSSASRDIQLSYTINRAQNSSRRYLNDYTIGVMIVEDNLFTTPHRGENTGRQLQNDGVVRAAQWETLKQSDTITIAISPVIKERSSKIVAIIQHKQNYKIVFANSFALPQQSS